MGLEGRFTASFGPDDTPDKMVARVAETVSGAGDLRVLCFEGSVDPSAGTVILSISTKNGER